MKTLYLSIAIATLCLTTQAAKNKVNYVITKNDTVFCKKVRIGLLNTKYIDGNNQKYKIAIKDIKRVCENCKVFEMKPVYQKGIKTNNKVLMELLGYRNGLYVYKSSVYDSRVEQMLTLVHIYKGDQLIKTYSNPKYKSIKSYLDKHAMEQEGLLSKY